jgi:hypothetical protein
MAIWAEAFGHPIEWVGPTSHRYADGLAAGSRGLVEHIASGFYEGTISWQRNTTTTNPTSSHWIVARDGRIAQMLDTRDASWAQSSGNTTWHSVENEGFGVDDGLHADYPGWELLTPEQVEANAALYAKGHVELGWPLQLASSPTGRGLGHHSMGAPDWGHAFCPGSPIIGQKQAILDRAIALLDPTQEEDDEEMSTGMLERGFCANGQDITDWGQVTGIGSGPVNGGEFGNKRCVLGLSTDGAPAEGVQVRVAIKSEGMGWGVKLYTLHSADNRLAIWLPDKTTKVSAARSQRPTDATDGPAAKCPVWWDLEFEKR